jgi:hypothetical protein
VAESEADQQSLNNLMREFGKHLVSMGWVDRTPSRVKANNGQAVAFQVSAFVVSVKGVWFLITAGHILKDIQDGVPKGQVLTDFFINDAWGPQSTNKPIPFDFKSAIKSFWQDDQIGVDYGAIRLRPNYRELLKAGKIEPFVEHTWVSPPTDIGWIFMMGFPSQFERIEGDNHTVNCVMLPLALIPEPDELKVDVPRMYAALPDRLLAAIGGQELTDLDGMSGGPVFGGKKVKGRMKYWLLGCQSATNKITIEKYRPGKIAIVSPFKIIGHCLELWVDTEGADTL